MNTYAIQDFLYHRLPWTSVVWARKHYGYEWSWLIRTWRESTPGKQSHLRGRQMTKTEDFFDRLIQRDHESVVMYRCIFGTCSVMWHPKRGNIGGYGRPGCECAEMDDPRDLKVGPLDA